MPARFDETWFFAPVQGVGSTIPLSSEESRHALRALRLRSGTEVFVTNGAGSVFLSRLEIFGDQASVNPLDRVIHEPEPPGLALALGMLKGRDVELPVEAACEFALRDVFLLQSDFSGEFEGQSFEKILERLQKKSVAALKQAKKAWLTRIHPPEDLRAWRARHADIPLALAHPGVDSLPSPLPEKLHVLVGPEGGFSQEELDYLLGPKNAFRLTLGPTRLRAIHAPIAALGNLTARGVAKARDAG